RIQGRRFLGALALCALLAYHDIAVLLGLGLLGAFRSTAPQARVSTWFCAGGLAGLVGLGAAAKLLSASLLERRAPKLGMALRSWTWQRSLQLLLLRTGYFAL